jgi:hypothetical protein
VPPQRLSLEGAPLASSVGEGVAHPCVIGYSVLTDTSTLERIMDLILAGNNLSLLVILIGVVIIAPTIIDRLSKLR